MLDSLDRPWTHLPHLVLTGLVALSAPALAACGGPAQTAPPPLSAELVSFAKSQPARGAETVPSACSDPASCQSECDGGSRNGCTRLGDWLHGSDPARAESLWLTSCKGRDSQACMRLMARAASDPLVADAYAGHACVYGSIDGCQMFGMHMSLRGLTASSPAARASLFGQAAEAFGQACTRGSWVSCRDAAGLHRQKELASAPEKATELDAKAVELALEACERNDHSACLALGDALEKSGNTADAKSVMARGCASMRQEIGQYSRPEVAMESQVCRRAAALGDIGTDIAPSAAVASSGDLRARSTAPGTVPPVILKSLRLRGDDKDERLKPPESVKQTMSERKQERLDVSFKMCLAISGLVTYLEPLVWSGYPVYDRTLIETIRDWRYQPYTLQGTPVPVCTVISFVYGEPRKGPIRRELP